MFSSDNLNNIPYLDLLSKPEQLISDIQYGFDGDIVRVYSGVPKGTILENHSGLVSFIHYTSSVESLSNIVKTSALKAGPVPYMFVSPGSKSIWRDAKGVFLTKHEFSPRQVGIPNSIYFVKFTLQPDVPVLKMGSAENIWLIPVEESIEVNLNVEGFGSWES